jgi:hypothetical protein
VARPEKADGACVRGVDRLRERGTNSSGITHRSMDFRDFLDEIDGPAGPCMSSATTSPRIRRRRCIAGYSRTPVRAALHADVLVVDQPGRAVVRQTGAALSRARHFCSLDAIKTPLEEWVSIWITSRPSRADRCLPARRYRRQKRRVPAACAPRTRVRRRRITVAGTPRVIEHESARIRRQHGLLGRLDGKDRRSLPEQADSSLLDPDGTVSL